MLPTPDKMRTDWPFPIGESPFLIKGQGFIGTAGFANFVNDPRWADHPAHLETPKTEKDDDGNETEMDPVNLATLRGLIG